MSVTHRNQNEVLFQTLTQALSALDEPVFLLSADLRVTYLNHAAESLFGPVLDQPARSIVPESALALLTEAAASRTNTEFRYAASLTAPAQTVRLVPLPEGGFMARCSGDGRGVTDVYRLIAAEAAGVGTWYWDVPRGELIWDGQCRRLFGLAPEEPISYERFCDLLHPDDRAGVDEAVRRTLEQGQPYALEYRTRWPDGSEHWIFATGRAEHDGTGRVLRMMGTAQNVSDRKRIEQALKEREERYRMAMAATNDAIWDWNLQTNFIEWNPAVESLFGYPLAQVDPQASWWTDHIHPDDRSAVTDSIHSVIDGASDHWHAEYRFRKADGSYVPVFDRGSVVRDATGKATRMVGSMLDLTVRKQAEETLRESEIRFRSLADNIPQLAWMADATGSLYWYNQRWYDYTGTTFEQMKGWGWQSVHDPNELPRVVERFKAAVAAGEPWEDIFPLRRHDGEMRWHLSRALPVRDENGQIIRWFGTNTDITERRTVEQALRESEERFRTLTEATPQFVWTCRSDGWCDYLSRQWVEYTGIPFEEQQGMRWTESLHPDDAERAAALWQAAVRGEATYDLEYRIRRYDGTYRWFKTRGLPLQDAAGRVVKWLGTSTDIDDQKQAEEALRRSNEDLQQFAYVASHDLQEPLRMISSYTQLLARRYQGKLDDKANEYINFAVDGAKRMQTLVQDLLRYSRAGTEAYHFQRMDLNEILARVLKDLQARIAETGAAVTHDPLPTLSVDEVKVGQVFQNLVGNAMKFRRAEEAPRIHIGAERRGRDWLFSVRDNGTGFEPEYAEKIFIIFQRLHHVGKFEGTGIGLAIVKRIIEGHGGRIWAESQPGTGSTFRFTLPVYRSERKDRLNQKLG